jgi:hypothetical protein
VTVSFHSIDAVFRGGRIIVERKDAAASQISFNFKILNKLKIGKIDVNVKKKRLDFPVRK